MKHDIRQVLQGFREQIIHLCEVVKKHAEVFQMLDRRTIDMHQRLSGLEMAVATHLAQNPKRVSANNNFENQHLVQDLLDSHSVYFTERQAEIAAAEAATMPPVVVTPETLEDMANFNVEEAIAPGSPNSTREVRLGTVIATQDEYIDKAQARRERRNAQARARRAANKEKTNESKN